MKPTDFWAQARDYAANISGQSIFYYFLKTGLSPGMQLRMLSMQAKKIGNKGAYLSLNR
jgi:hypothetical protein